MGLEKAKQHARQSKAKAESKGKSRKDYGGFSFININPTKGDAMQAKQAFEAGEMAVDDVWEFVELGFDFAVKYVPESEGWKATFTDMREGSETFKAQLRLDAGSPVAATLKAVFFMKFRFETTWRATDQGSTDAEDWF